MLTAPTSPELSPFELQPIDILDYTFDFHPEDIADRDVRGADSLVVMSIRNPVGAYSEKVVLLRDTIIKNALRFLDLKPTQKSSLEEILGNGSTQKDDIQSDLSRICQIINIFNFQSQDVMILGLLKIHDSGETNTFIQAPHMPPPGRVMPEMKIIDIAPFKRGPSVDMSDTATKIAKALFGSQL